MSTTTTRLGMLKPDPTEVANYLTQLNANWDKLDAYASFERLSSFPGSPLTGKSVQRSDHDSQPYFYNGSGWVSLERYRAPVQSQGNSAITTTSLTFTQGSIELSGTIVARGNGNIYVSVGGEIDNSTTANTYLSFEIRNDTVSGSVVLAADDRRGIEMQDTFSAQLMARLRVEGLTAGNTYFVRCMHRVSAGTGTYNRRTLVLEHG